MKHIEKKIYRHLLVGTILGALALVGVTFVILSAVNPLVDYRGNTMRKSVMLTVSPDEVFCQQMSSFSLGAMYTCFDSEAELDAFAESR